MKKVTLFQDWEMQEIGHTDSNYDIYKLHFMIKITYHLAYSGGWKLRIAFRRVWNTPS